MSFFLHFIIKIPAFIIKVFLLSRLSYIQLTGEFLPTVHYKGSSIYYTGFSSLKTLISKSLVSFYLPFIIKIPAFIIEVFLLSRFSFIQLTGEFLPTVHYKDSSIYYTSFSSLKTLLYNSLVSFYLPFIIKILSFIIRVFLP